MGRSALATLGLVVGAGMLATACSRSAEADPEAVQSGRTLFAATCARCHGATGKGGLPLWDGGPSPRDLTDHEFQASRADDGLRVIITEGKPPGMPAFGKTFDDAQLRAIVAYVRTLDRNR